MSQSRICTCCNREVRMHPETNSDGLNKIGERQYWCGRCYDGFMFNYAASLGKNIPIETIQAVFEGRKHIDDVMHRVGLEIQDILPILPEE